MEEEGGGGALDRERRVCTASIAAAGRSALFIISPAKQGIRQCTLSTHKKRHGVFGKFWSFSDIAPFFPQMSCFLSIQRLFPFVPQMLLPDQLSLFLLSIAHHSTLLLPTRKEKRKWKVMMAFGKLWGGRIQGALGCSPHFFIERYTEHVSQMTISQLFFRKKASHAFPSFSRRHLAYRSCVLELRTDAVRCN